jgi:hypothetical protein
VLLTERQRSLLLDHDLIPDDLKAPLRVALVAGNDFEVQFKLGNLGRLVGYAGAEAAEGSRATGDEWDGIYRALVEAGNGFVASLPPGAAAEELDTDEGRAETEEMLHQFLETLPPEVVEEIEVILEREEFGSIEALEERVMDVVDSFNQRPYDGYGGLTPYRMDRLMNSEWNDPETGMWINRDISFEDVAGTRVLHNARVLLTALRGSGGTKATAKGNLNRKFVSEMLDRMALPEWYVELKRNCSKVLNESDVPKLEYLRLALRELGLVRRYKGKIVVTRAGKDALRDEKAGDLYADLFRAYFQRINLGFRDRLPDVEMLQETAPYIFWRLWEAAREWRSAADLAEEVILPWVQEEMREELHPDVWRWPLQGRILETLVEFGLLEERGPQTEERRAGRREYRKTGLYDSFLKFEWGE